MSHPRTSNTLRCAYCNRRFPRDNDHFPFLMYAECYWCAFVNRDDRCPRCGSQEIATEHRLTKRRWWPGWLAGAWKAGPATRLWCRDCDLRVRAL